MAAGSGPSVTIAAVSADYYALRFTVPPALADAAAGLLAAAGAAGIEEIEEIASPGAFRAYFSSPALVGEGIGVLSRLLLENGAGPIRLECEFARGRDWQEEFRRSLVPFALGSRFAVDPREDGGGDLAADLAGREVLRLIPERAFGIGTHESTRLAVELLEATPMILDATVIDAGTGSGILALAAERLGARRAIAFDNDIVAVVVARGNLRRNGAARILLFAGEPAGLAPKKKPPCAGRVGPRLLPENIIVANMIAEEVVPLLPDLAALAGTGGSVILSGILVGCAEEVIAAAATRALHEVARLQREDWIALRFQRG